MVLPFSADREPEVQPGSIRYTVQTWGKTEVKSTSDLNHVIIFKLNTVITQEQVEKAKREAKYYFGGVDSVSFWR